ncbi:MAG: hypothetical protein SGBAC_009595 [Bacillariaceae sp.]
MASRDLTASFMQRRSNARRRRGDRDSQSVPLTAGGSDHALMLLEEGGKVPDSSNGGGIEMSSLNKRPPSWVRDVDSVKEVLADIKRQMEELQSMHASRVGSVFGKDLDHMEGRIEVMTREITNHFRDAERTLKKVGTSTRNAGGEEAAIGANVQRSLAKQLQELSVSFRTSQRIYLAEVQAQKNGDMVGDSKFGITLDEGGGENNFFTTQQVAVVDDLQSAIQSRDEEISKIAQSIEELGTIFKELAVLVIDQGTILDRIDYNMEAVVEHTKTGVTQLEKAEKQQKNARPMKCIVSLVMLIAILLFLLVLKHRHRRHRW